MIIIIQPLFNQNSAQYERARNDKESMIYLMPKPSQKNFQNNWSFLWPPSSPDHNPLDYIIWGILENKTNTTFHRILVHLRLEWNKMSEEFILKSCKLFWSHIDTIIEKKKGGYIE